MNRPLLLAISLMLSAVSTSVVNASETPRIFLEQSSKNDKTVSYSVKASTGPDGISAAEVFLSVPIGLTLTSENTSSSVFETEVTKAVQTKQQIHIARASLVAGGIHSQNALISTLVFSLANSSMPAPTIEAKGSKLIQYSDSKDVLHTTVSTAPAVVEKTSTTQYFLPVAVGSLLLVGGVLLYFNRRNKL